MAGTLRWTGFGEADRVAEARWQCYGQAGRDVPRFRDELLEDRRALDGDFLIAESDGRLVGTATNLAMTLWARGGKFPCTGVAWVGVVKSQRRRGAAGTIMAAVIKRAREAGAVVSALSPFRASFYRRFGYGLIERRVQWTIPMGVLPSEGDSDGQWRVLEKGDFAAQAALRQKMTEMGQCDIERGEAGWNVRRRCGESDGQMFFRSDGGAYASVCSEAGGVLRVWDWGVESVGGMAGLLRFFCTLKDQYSVVSISTPADWPINYLLKEEQLPHRPVAHAAASMGCCTRLQMRVLDHRRWMEGLRWPAGARGGVNVRVRETEGGESAFRMEVEAGRAVVKAIGGAAGGSSGTVVCTDALWASMTSGELPASAAARMGLVEADGVGAGLLDELCRGSAPYCHEIF